jgi:hypothetical protein
MRFKKEVVKEYGEQVFRDSLARYPKAPKSDAALNFCSWSSAFVAWGVGLITEKQLESFRKTLITYVKKTRFPRNFL